MRKNKKELSSEELCQLVVNGMLEKKGEKVVVLDLRNVKNAITDYFVICSGNSDTQIDAIATSIEDEVFKATQTHAWQKEGKQNREWILIDYVDVVAHVFRKDRRAFYDLEALWGDAEITIVEESFDTPPQQRPSGNFSVAQRV